MLVRPIVPPIVQPLRAGSLPWESAGGGRASAPHYDANLLGSKLTLWLRGDVGLTLVGSDVDAQADQQTQNTARNFTAASAGVRPTTRAINGRTVVDYAGVDEYLASTATITQVLSVNSYEVFIVYYLDAITSSGSFYDVGDGLFVPASPSYMGASLRNNAGAYTMTVGHFDGAVKQVTPTVTLGAVQLLHWIFDGSTISAQIDSSAALTVAAGNVADGTSTLQVGKARTEFYLNGAVCEVIVCNAVCSAGERTAVRGALASWWGGGWS